MLHCLPYILLFCIFLNKGQECQPECICTTEDAEHVAVCRVFSEDCTFYLQLACNRLIKFGLATMDYYYYDSGGDGGGGGGDFFKRIMLREVMPQCDEDKLMNYLAKLQAINPESIINLAAIKDLGGLCSDLDKSVNEINDYLGKCTPPRQKNLYYDLIRGVQALDDKLCKDKQFQEEFMKSAECFERLSEEYLQCAGPADWIENPNEQEICKAYKDIADCYYVKTALVCGSEKAHKFKELLMWVIDNIVRVKCKEIAGTPVVPDVLNEKQPKMQGKSTTFSLIPLFVILSIIIFIILVYTTSRCLRNNNEEKNEKKDSQKKYSEEKNEKKDSQKKYNEEKNEKKDSQKK